MEIPLLDLKAQYRSIKSAVEEAMKGVVEDQTFILSRDVTELENEIAVYCGVSHAAGVASGTDAIMLALRALGVSEGDLVITTPFTFFATSEAVSILGAKPVFADIDPETYNIDPGKITEVLENAHSDVRSKIKAVIPVHLYGQCADMERIMDIANEYDLKVVEDCAQAIGAYHKGKKAGSFGDAGCLSFFPSKNLGGFGDGGMVVSSKDAITDKIKTLRVHGSSESYMHGEVGCNSRLDSLQAAVLRVKLKKLDTWLEQRRIIAQKYDESFSSPDIVTPKVGPGNVHTYHQYTIAVDKRDELMQYLQEKGIASRVYYPVPLHLQPCYKDMGYPEGSFPVGEQMARKVLSLPIYPELTDEQTDYVIDSVKGFFKK
jgi:dTDP-4-amino-4,6-dideoxygalactose transaminase